MPEKSYRLDLQYHGAPFAGWQEQPGATAVQGSLKESYSEFLGVFVEVEGSARTDAGVHARHQIALLRAETNVPARAIHLGILPYQREGMHVFRAVEVANTWRPRPALSREYRYFLWKEADPPLFLRPFTSGTNCELDLARMVEAAGYLEGEQDFTSLRAAGCTARHAIRRVERVDVIDRGPYWEFRVIGNAFLRQMVRIMVGTLVNAGSGKIEPADVGRILEKKDRALAGPTVPPQGLFLWRIALEEDEEIAIPPTVWETTPGGN